VEVPDFPSRLAILIAFGVLIVIVLLIVIVISRAEEGGVRWRGMKIRIKITIRITSKRWTRREGEMDAVGACHKSNCRAP
jgi:hypothetical protein